MTLQLKVLLWSFCAIAFALLAFFGVTFSRAFSNPGPAAMLSQLSEYQLAEARHAYESGGVPALRTVIRRMDAQFQARHHLTGAQGQNLLSAESLNHWLPLSPGTQPYRRNTDLVFATQSPDRRYRWIVIKPPPIDAAAIALNLLIVLATIALFSWALATHIARPLLTMARTLQRFGAGELGLRLHSSRRDEIGQLSLAFDQMANRIEQLLGLERQLLQDISHELRSPLARLSVAAQLTLRPSEREPATHQIEKEIQRLNTLISDLVSTTRLESGAAEPLPLASLIEDVIRDCDFEAAVKYCRITTRLEASPTLEGVPELLRRALENVLRNAVRHAPDASIIDVELRETGPHVEIAIRDRGPGVPPAALSRIFQAFYRVGEARSHPSGGIGLGLAIAQRAISLHHGRITAQNASPGLRISITLPLQKPI